MNNHADRDQDADAAAATEVTKRDQKPKGREKKNPVNCRLLHQKLWSPPGSPVDEED